MNGVLLIDKPLGPTSTDIVRIVRRTLNTRKVGHAGTLDPQASGLLVVAVGAATRIIQFLQSTQKSYTTTIRFGSETLTDDADGEVIRRTEHIPDSQRQIETCLATYHGTIQQKPPRVSALKTQGRRLHERVRAGENVDDEIQPRPVQIYSLQLENWQPPSVTLQMTVGKGFYVRSLARDLGRALESAAHVERLRRTRIGAFDVEDAIAPEQVQAHSLISMEEALAHLNTAHADEIMAQRIHHGQRVHLDESFDTEGPSQVGDLIRVLAPNNKLIAVSEVTEGRVLRVVRGFRI